MATALSFAELLLGLIADKLRHRGVRPHAILAATASLFIAMQTACVARFYCRGDRWHRQGCRWVGQG
jgi:hypothetical protein